MELDGLFWKFRAIFFFFSMEVMEFKFISKFPL
jgi:hypothetical protein